MIAFLERWGMALSAPRAALAGADEPESAGRAASDLLRAIAVLLVVAHTRALVAAGWIAVEVGVRDAGPGLLRALSSASMFSLLFVVVAAPVVTIGAGRHRNLGRDFDLACVAALVPVTIGLVASLIAQAMPLGAAGRAAILFATLGWGGVLVALGVMQARRRA